MSPILKLQGRLRLKSKDQLRWLRSPAVPAPADVFEAGGFPEPGNAPEWDTVEALLTEIFTSRRLRVKLTFARSPVVIDGMVPADMVARYWPALVGAFSLASEMGGTGELTLADRTSRAHLTVGGGVSKLEKVDLLRAARAAQRRVRVPGTIERARSGRSSCKVCQQGIDKGSSRFGAQNLARSAPGKPNYAWFHLVCAARAMPYSLGPVLRECSQTVDERDAVWSMLSEDARTADIVAVFNKGDRIVVTSDTKGAPCGARGTVVWFGTNKFGPGLRVGVELEGESATTWIDADCVAADHSGEPG